MTPDSYFTLTFYARKPKTEKSEYPLYARISVGGQMTEFTIGRSVNLNTGTRNATRAMAHRAATRS